VRTCLAKAADDRWQTARDLVRELKWTADAQAEVSRPGALRGVPTPARLGRRVLTAFAAVALLVLCGLTFVAGRRTGERPIPSFRQLTFRRGTVEVARFSADGNTIFYTAAWNGQPYEMFSTRPDTVISRSLDQPHMDLLAVSAREMAVRVNSPESGQVTLARIPLGGGAPREVLAGVAAADWSPDGVSFAVTRGERGRFRLEYPVGKPLYESNGYIENPRISPRGDRVALIDHPIPGDSEGAVMVVDLAGMKRTLSSGWNDISGLAWSDDGQEVWFAAAREGSARGLRAVTLSGEERLLARVPGALTLQDVHGGRALVTHTLFRTEVRALAPHETSERDLSWLDLTFALDMSEDGRMVLLNEDGEGGGPGRSVYLRRTDGSSPVRLGGGLGRALSPDGRWAIVLVPTTPPQLTLLPTGAGEPRALPRGTLAELQWAYWFPDGRHILILGSETGRPSRLFLQDVGGGEPRPLTAEGADVSVGTKPISVDGKLVAVFIRGSHEGWFAYPVNGGEPRPIAGLEGLTPIRWSGDGTHLFVWKRSLSLPARVLRLDLSTGRVEPWRDLRPLDDAGVPGIMSVLLTPDGQSYAYNYARNLSDLYLVDGLR
jgi:eukaryotic-like serine/threonine-protein kinase